MKFFIVFVFSLIGLLESRKKKLGGASKIVSSYSFGKHFLKSFNGVVLNHHGYVKNKKLGGDRSKIWFLLSKNIFQFI